MGGWFGMGTEYALGEKLALDFEWAWRFFLTRDTKTWRDSEDDVGQYAGVGDVGGRDLRVLISPGAQRARSGTK